MSKRISVTQKELKRVQKELKKDKNMTLDDVSKHIGAHFRHHLYQGINMSIETFNNLQDLYGQKISHEVLDHKNGVSYDKRITKLEKNEELAEFAGILLGDGHIKDFNTIKDGKHVTVYRTKVTLHSKEKQMIKNVETLFENISGRKPSTCKRKTSRAVDISLYSKDLVDLLKEIGLKPGNKTENQVSVPKWIKEDRGFQKRCLKGLTDTDGTIYIRGEENATVVQFKNASKPLLADFDEMCGNLDIRCSKGGYRTVQIAAKDEVDRFIRLIKPIKARSI